MAVLEDFCPYVAELFGWGSQVVKGGDDFDDFGGVHDVMRCRESMGRVLECRHFHV